MFAEWHSITSRAITARPWGGTASSTRRLKPRLSSSTRILKSRLLSYLASYDVASNMSARPWTPGMEALTKLYEITGMGWLFKLAKLPVLSNAANLAYKVELCRCSPPRHPPRFDPRFLN